jgi:HEPN domain-containing protein
MNTMPEPSQSLAKSWFRKAENDLLNVENNLKAEKYPGDTVCFHCQQVAEKYLKGLLAWHQVSFVKTHDLFALLKQVKQILGEDANFLDQSISLLDDYSVSIRYPQEVEEDPTDKEVQLAYEAALAVRTWVRDRLDLD